MSTEVDLAARARHWLENGGAEQLAAALVKADEASQKFLEASRVDWREMMEPMTI